MGIIRLKEGKHGNMRILSAKDYAALTGYPMKTLCRLCRLGIIPHEKRGRGYLINADVVDEIINKRMESNLKAQNQFQGPMLVPKVSGESFLERLKAVGKQ